MAHRAKDRAVSRAVVIGRCEHGREVTQELRLRGEQLRVAYSAGGVTVTWPAPGPTVAEVEAFFAGHMPTALWEAEQAAARDLVTERRRARDPLGSDAPMTDAEMHQAVAELRLARPARERLRPVALVPDATMVADVRGVR